MYIDRFGYADFAADLSMKVSALMKERPIESASKRYLFYSLLPLKNHLAEVIAGPEWKKSDEATTPAKIEWGAGCYGEEIERGRRWHWCGHEGELALVNPSRHTMQVDMDMMLAPGAQPQASLEMTGDLVQRKIDIASSGTPLHLVAQVPPGRHSIHFRCNGMTVNARSDPRTLVFMVEDFRAAIH